MAEVALDGQRPQVPRQTLHGARATARRRPAGRHAPRPRRRQPVELVLHDRQPGGPRGRRAPLRPAGPRPVRVARHRLHRRRQRRRPRALLDHWGSTEPVHLFGNSFGGVIALAFAHRHPERVASLFLVEAHFAVEGWGEHMAGSLALAAFGLDQDGVQDWLDEQRRPQAHPLRPPERAPPHEDQPHRRPAARGPSPWLAGGIRCPTFALYGAESDILDRARQLEAHVPGCELRDRARPVPTRCSPRSPPLVRERAPGLALGSRTPEPLPVRGAAAVRAT